MKHSINDSLQKIRLIESSSTLNEATAVAPAATAAGKGLGRFVPGVGAAIGAYDAYDRYKKGDYVGAALSGLGGAASLVPGIGTAASLGIAGAQLGRDYQAKTGVFAPDEAEPVQSAQAVPAAKPPSVAVAPVRGVNPQVLALQKQLIAKGAKIVPDGIMGPRTQAAMKQFPDVQLASKINKIKGKMMSESEKIAALRARLDQINQANDQVNEGPLDIAKGALSAGKSMYQAAKTGLSGAPVATGKLTKTGAAQMVGQGSKQFAKQLATMPVSQRAAYQVGTAGKSLKAAPVKTGLGAAALGGAAGYMAGKPGAAPTVSAAPAKPAGTSAQAAPATAPAQAAQPGIQISLDPGEMAELQSLAKELANDPSAAELMTTYTGLMSSLKK